MPFYNQINNFLSQEDDPQAFEKFFDENKRLDVIRNQQYEEIFKEWHDKLLLR